MLSINFRIPWIQTGLPVWFFYIIVGVFGVCIGSFLNVLIFRIPKHEEFVKTSSHCMTCGHKLAWYDNIPLISYIMIGGKCRYCKTKLSPQYPIIEALNGAVWVGLFLIRGWSYTTFLECFLFSALLVLSIIDFRTYEIENGFHIFIFALAIINAVLLCLSGNGIWWDYLIGAFAASVPLAIIFFISKGKAIGGADPKLMFACGAFLGWKGALLALGVGCIFGAIIHPIRMKVGKADRVLAMGPYLSAGVMFAILFGEKLITMYLSLFGF